MCYAFWVAPTKLRHRPDLELINFSWLLKLRWGAIAGQILTILAVDRIMQIRLPLGLLAGIVGLELLTTCSIARACAARGRFASGSSRP